MENGDELRSLIHDLQDCLSSIEMAIRNLLSMVDRIATLAAGTIVGDRSSATGAFLVQLSARRIVVGSHELILTREEWLLFEFLWRRPGTVVDASAIISAVWVDVDPAPETVRLRGLVHRLNNTLKSAGFPGGVANRRGLGYFLRLDA